MVPRGVATRWARWGSSSLACAPKIVRYALARNDMQAQTTAETSEAVSGPPETARRGGGALPRTTRRRPRTGRAGFGAMEDLLQLLAIVTVRSLAGSDELVFSKTRLLAYVALSGRLLPGVMMPVDNPVTTWRAEQGKLLKLHVPLTLAEELLGRRWPPPRSGRRARRHRGRDARGRAFGRPSGCDRGLRSARIGMRCRFAYAFTSRRKRLPIFSNSAGDGIGWPRWPVRNRTTGAIHLQV